LDLAEEVGAAFVGEIHFGVDSIVLFDYFAERLAMISSAMFGGTSSY
jgi:hypothetical protein